MKLQSPPVVYFPKQSPSVRNASHSKIYLNKTNYSCRPPLHTKIESRTTCPTETDTGLHMITLPRMMSTVEDEDIFAPPLSSSDEDEATSYNEAHGHDHLKPPKTKRRSGISDTPSMPSKRTKTAHRPKKPPDNARLQAQSGHEQTAITAHVSSGWDDWVISSQHGHSQSSQGKRKETYSKKSTFGTSTKASSKKDGFVPVPKDISEEEVSTTKLSKNNSSSFVNIDVVKASPRKSRRNSKPDFESVPPILEPETEPSKFSMPKFEPDDIAEMQLSPKRERSGSTGSSVLSEVDSIVSLQLTREQKDELQGVGTKSVIANLPPDHIRCPVCAQPVNKSTLSRFSASPVLKSKQPNKLPLQQQQDFCYKHRVHDAQAEWTSKAYPPNIDWTDLETRRVTKYIPRLRKILYRKQSSHYMSILESKITGAKGNKTKIKRYLNEGLVDVVKTGYYGPRGAKIIAHAITEHMSKALRMQQKADKLVMMVGVSGFVSAVLLPEAATLLVMDDMNLSDQSRARTVLDESTHVGLLLCPDDDHVERQDDIEDE